MTAQIETKNIDNHKHQLIGVGRLSKHYRPSYHFDNVEDLISSSLLSEIPPDAVILVKGSNSIKLDKIKGLI
jgi:UDP-N-acetylmuramyl pentapeptide synthase